MWGSHLGLPVRALRGNKLENKYGLCADEKYKNIKEA